MEHHTLCVPDEAAAIEASNAWLAGAPPAGRPYEAAADTSGYAIGGICGQCCPTNGKLLVLLYICQHLADHQTYWHSCEQELWGLLATKREIRKQLGSIPVIMHTDHANLARLENLPAGRIEAKIFRWFSEIVGDGSVLLHRPGQAASHRGPDGISRNPPGRDKLIRAKDSEWKYWRQRIRGIQEAIQSGKADAEDPESLTLEKLEKDNPEALEELPPAEGLAVATKYERVSNEHKSGTARGEKKQREAREAPQVPPAEAKALSLIHISEPTRPY